jgi:hypothetical protein
MIVKGFKKYCISDTMECEEDEGTGREDEDSDTY